MLPAVSLHLDQPVFLPGAAPRAVDPLRVGKGGNEDVPAQAGLDGFRGTGRDPHVIEPRARFARQGSTLVALECQYRHALAAQGDADFVGSVGHGYGCSQRLW